MAIEWIHCYEDYCEWKDNTRDDVVLCRNSNQVDRNCMRDCRDGYGDKFHIMYNENSNRCIVLDI